jgi:K+-transporting ATPase ATPase C chain
MTSQLRANLWLLLLTVVICSVLYPAVLWGIGQTVFRGKADGSLIDRNGNPVADEKEAVGSRLIAQPFSGDEYFQPRPSAASYNGAASAATNWGASNPALRKRVVGMLGQVLKYRDGQPVGPDIVTWVRERLRQDPALLAQWFNGDASLAERWVSADKANADFLTGWEKEHPEDIARWRQENPDAEEIKLADLAALYFESYAKGETKVWPKTDGKDIQAIFFEMWWQAHPGTEFQPVPADMVMASGSGLDPHITLKNALYQLDRVAGKWADTTRRDSAQVRKEIEDLLRQKIEAPLGGLAGVDLVNVLEVNLALRQRYGTRSGASR